MYNGLFIPKGARDITARVLKMIADYYLIRCLVDWKYLVGRVQTVFVAWPLILLMMRRAITRDPDVYPEPEVFKPERFLNLNGTLRDGFILTSVFGFGKRVCPGRHFADTTLFIVAATVLSVFRIERRHDTEGVPFDYTYSGGLVRCVKRFLLEEFRELIVIQSPELVSVHHQPKG